MIGVFSKNQVILRWQGQRSAITVVRADSPSFLPHFHVCGGRYHPPHTIKGNEE